jgi:hypothetical protein
MVMVSPTSVASAPSVMVTSTTMMALPCTWPLYSMNREPGARQKVAVRPDITQRPNAAGSALGCG